jgi:hypothetical protein
MTRLIPAAERLIRARALIQKARNLPLEFESGWQDFEYIAQVKDLLRQARDLIKFITYSPSATPEMKKEVAAVFTEADTAEQELLHR